MILDECILSTLQVGGLSEREDSLLSTSLVVSTFYYLYIYKYKLHK